MKNNIEKIFLSHNLPAVNKIEKSGSGFTNDVYFINDKYVLKICEDVENEENFIKENRLYNYFKDSLPVPEIVIFDSSKIIYNKIYSIQKRIIGNNLYSLWHTLDNKNRKEIIKDICHYLKIINSSDIHFIKTPSTTWDKTIHSKINAYLNKLKNIIDVSFIEDVRSYTEKHVHVFKNSSLYPVHNDIHFDNILVEKSKIREIFQKENSYITGLIDFERVDYAPLDYTLDTIKRMVDYPAKYMSDKYKHLGKKEDYENLLNWFSEYYPEMFDFNSLDIRLNLYTIEHDLETLVWYPEAVELIDIIKYIID